MKKICVVTGTRAEYGLLQYVMQGIDQAADLQLQLVATGMHLSPEFGLTYRQIEADGFRIDRQVEMLLSSDTGSGIAKSMGLAMIGFADALAELKPDLMLVLGDRFEIFAAVSAAMVQRIPVAHLHGGEATEGVIDEAIRHSISKMSHLHFAAAEPYRKRIVQLGESPDRVFLVGGLGVDAIQRMPRMTREELERSLEFQLGPRNLLVTFHPVTLEDATSAEQMSEMLEALADLPETHLILTMPNADADGRVLFDMIKQFTAEHPRAAAFTSLGQQRYLSCLAIVDGVVGNSSSGILEAPTFKKGTINIGDRQRGRLQADSVINCPPERQAIVTAIEKLYSDDFQETLAAVESPYGEGGASDQIVRVLQQTNLNDLLKKSFYDLECNIE